jgi:subtilisin family serine protease
MTGLLRLSTLVATGLGVRVAVIDSGVHAAHPHVQGVSGGIGIDAQGRQHRDFTDRLGHGTAVIAAIREKAPDAEIFAIKVFDRELATTGPALVAAIEWAIEQRARLINLSLGTINAEHEQVLAAAVARARAADVFVIAAAPQNGARWLPGALREVVSVEVDWTLGRDRCRVEVSRDEQIRVWASGFPRPIPGVPPERNLKGPSFAVANATGLFARVVSATTDHLPAAIAGALTADSGSVPSS